jgi:hypothetical protein
LGAISQVQGQLEAVVGLVTPPDVAALQARLDKWSRSTAVHKMLYMLLGEQRISVWVDSCSPITMVSEAFVKAHGLRLHSVVPLTRYVGLNSPLGLQFAGSCTFALTLGQTVVEVIAAVLKSSLPQGCDVLLGNYCMGSNDLAVTLLANKVVIRRRSNSNDVLMVSYPFQWLEATNRESRHHRRLSGKECLNTRGEYRHESTTAQVADSDATNTHAVYSEDKESTNAQVADSDAASTQAVHSEGRYDTNAQVADRAVTSTQGVFSTDDDLTSAQVADGEATSSSSDEGAKAFKDSNYARFRRSLREEFKEQPSEKDRTSNVGKVVRLSTATDIFVKGEFCVMAQVEGFSRSRTRHSTVRLEIPLEWRPYLKIQPLYEWSVATTRGVARLIIQVHSLGVDEMITLPQGLQLGVVEEDEELGIAIKLTESQKNVKVIGGLIGSTSDEHLPPTAALISLNSVKAKQLAERTAKLVIRAFLQLTKEDKQSLIEKVVGIRKAGKAFKMEMGDPPPVIFQSSDSLPAGSHIWLPLAASENAHGDLHDGVSINDAAEDMSIGTHNLPELSDLEFFVALGGHEFNDESGCPLVTQPERAQQFLKIVTDIFRFREAGLFRLNYNKILSKIQGVQYQVVMKDGEELRPFDSGRRKYGDKETLEICRQVMQLLQSGILSPIRSAWSSGLVMVKKGDGGIRMCVDLRSINSKTLHIASQLPLISDVLQDSFTIRDRIFSQLDLSQAYHQLEVAPSSREFLSFKLPRISAEQCKELGFSPPFQVTWNRVPFGLSDAVTSFSNLVMEIFQPQGFSPYLDDLATGSSSVEGMRVKLEQIFTLAAKHGLTFGSKLVLYASEITFLGHQVMREGVRVSPKRAEELIAMPSPTNIQEVKIYLGAVGFCADYLGHRYAEIAAPLSDLLKDPLRKDFGWTSVHDIAIAKLKELLTSPPILKVFDNTLETSITTDGSIKGVGAVLQQLHSDGWHPVFYMSKKLTDVQSRWATSQFELYAIILALDRWRRFLIDRPFTMLSDHQALSFIKQPKLFEGRRLRRWQMLLSEFQFIISYKPGVEIGLPDCLSRMAPEAFTGAVTTDIEWSTEGEDFYLDKGESALIDFIDTCSLVHHRATGNSRGHQSETPVISLAISKSVVRDSLLSSVLLSSAQKSRLQKENVSRKGFKQNMPVWVETPEWGRLAGRLVHRLWKGAALSKEQWWWVDFKDAGHSDPWPGEEWRIEHRDILTPQQPLRESTTPTAIRQIDRNDQIDLPVSNVAADAAPSLSSLPKTGCPNFLLGTCRFGNGCRFSHEVEPVPIITQPIILGRARKWHIGDIVQVRIGHFTKFRLSTHSLQPLGQIDAINEIGVRVRLFLEHQPWHIIRPAAADESLTLLATAEDIRKIKISDKYITYDVRDVVIVVKPMKRQEIVKKLIEMKVFPSDTTSEILVGIVVGRGHVNNSYHVHFGSVENGVELLLQTDLHLLKSSNVAQLAELNLGALPSMAGIGRSNDDPDLLTSVAGPPSLIPSPPGVNPTVNSPTSSVVVQSQLRLAWLQEVAVETRKDPELSRIRDYLVDGIISPLWTHKLQLRLDMLKKLYVVDSDLLYVVDSKGHQRLWLPATLRLTACFLVHDSMQHFDWQRSYQLFTSHFYMRGAPEIIRRYVGSCLSCQRSRARKYWDTEYGSELAERMYYFCPSRHWAIDLKPIPKGSTHKFTQLLVAMDLCSRFVVVLPLEDKTKEVVTTAIFTHIITRFSAHTKDGSMEFLCDRGSEFINDYKDALFRLYNIQCTEIQERHAASNGMVERFMQTFNLHFSKVMSDKILNPNEWSVWVTQLAACFNALYHPLLGNSPYYLMNGCDYELAPLINSFGANYSSSVQPGRESAEVFTAQRAKDYRILLDLLRSRFLSKRRSVELERAFAHRVPTFDVDDRVLVLLGDSNGGYLMKNRAHAGPFRIVGRSSTSNYQVAGADNQVVDVHGFKLLRYSESLADLLGNQGLAGSAVGAAASRLLGFEDRLPSLSPPLLIHESLIPQSSILIIQGVSIRPSLLFAQRSDDSVFLPSSRFNRCSRFDCLNTSAVAAYFQSSGEVDALSQAYVEALT